MEKLKVMRRRNQNQNDGHEESGIINVKLSELCRSNSTEGKVNKERRLCLKAT
jgi:hypothetical protein